MKRCAMLAALALIIAACGEAETADAPAGASVPADLLEEVRQATERFRDVEVALAEGYIPDPMNSCETAEMMGLPSDLGAMGLHYFRPDLLQITGVEPRVAGMGTHTDFLEPSVLIYEPQADGSMELVAVENVVFEAGLEAAGGERPSFAGVPYDYMRDDPATELDEAHGFEPHYDLHVWVHRKNPNGMFAQFNPDVTCAHHEGAGHQHP